MGTHRNWEEDRGYRELYGGWKDLGVTWESILVADIKREKTHNGIGVSGLKTNNDDMAMWEEGEAEESDQELLFLLLQKVAWKPG